MCMLPKAKKDARATGGGPSNVRLNQENELVLSAAEEASTTADCEPKPEPNEEDTEVDFMFEDGLMENQSLLLNKEKNQQDLEMSNLEVQEQDPFLEANREVESQDSVTTPDEEEEIDDEKFIRRVRKKIAVQELEKMEAENFIAQLRRNMAIAKYNKVLGKNIPLRPLPDMGL